jgi:hypothetical protein
MLQDRCPHDSDLLAAKDVIEDAAVAAVAVADQSADPVVGEVEAEVARLLGDLGAGGIGRAPSEPDAAARVCDEEEHVLVAQDDALNREEDGMWRGSGVRSVVDDRRVVVAATATSSDRTVAHARFDLS